MNADGKLKLEPIDFSSRPDTFVVDGHGCFVLKYEHKYAKGYFGYKSIEQDLVHCLELLDVLEKNQKDNPSVITFACTTSLIVTYGRCFTSTNGHRATLGKRHVPKKFRNSHNRIMEFRHTYIAHAGGGGEGSANYIALYPNPDHKKVIAIAPPIPMRISGLSKDTRSDIRGVLVHLIQLINKKMQKCYKSLVKDLMNIDIDEFYKHFENLSFDKSHKPEIMAGSHGSYKITITPEGRCLLRLVRPDIT